MRRILIVAQREFLQIARTKSFWLTLLITPAMVLVMPLIGRFFDPPETSRYILHDASGRYGAAIVQRLERNNQRDELFEFAAYARRWGLKSPDTAAVWDDGERPFSDEEVDAFVAAGGVTGALKEAGGSPKEAPEFSPPAPDYMRMETPADVPTDAGAEAFGGAVSRYLAGARDRPEGVRPATLAIYIPEGFGPAAPARIWTSSAGGMQLIDMVRRELSGAVRLEAALAAGLDEATATSVQSATAPVVVSAPPRGEGRERMALRTALPLGIAYFLLISVFVSGAWLLQGVMEERGNKLLESILACVSPRELMYGKLLGIAAIGMSVILVWGGFIIGGAMAMPSGPVSDVLKPAIGSMGSGWLLLALIFYFITGYLICAMLYLTIGAISESISDAQAYLAPISILLFLPFFALGQLISNPDAIAAKVLSWIPVYTPFAMMARMGAGVETYEVVGTSLLLLAFIALELWLLGRVFQTNLLRTGQPPKLAQLARLVFARTSKT